MSKAYGRKSILKNIFTIQNKVHALWSKVGQEYGMNLQTIMRELSELERKVESYNRKKHNKDAKE